jgi:hypothetical protein
VDVEAGQDVTRAGAPRRCRSRDRASSRWCSCRRVPRTACRAAGPIFANSRAPCGRRAAAVGRGVGLEAHLLGSIARWSWRCR